MAIYIDDGADLADSILSEYDDCPQCQTEAYLEIWRFEPLRVRCYICGYEFICSPSPASREGR